MSARTPTLLVAPRGPPAISRTVYAAAGKAPLQTHSTGAALRDSPAAISWAQTPPGAAAVPADIAAADKTILTAVIRPSAAVGRTPAAPSPALRGAVRRQVGPAAGVPSPVQPRGSQSAAAAAEFPAPTTTLRQAAIPSHLWAASASAEPLIRVTPTIHPRTLGWIGWGWTGEWAAAVSAAAAWTAWTGWWTGAEAAAVL
jgi:hypothetical protein